MEQKIVKFVGRLPRVPGHSSISDCVDATVSMFGFPSLSPLFVLMCSTVDCSRQMLSLVFFFLFPFPLVKDLVFTPEEAYITGTPFLESTTNTFVVRARPHGLYTNAASHCHNFVKPRAIASIE